jgi:hypothetical protein
VKFYKATRLDGTDFYSGTVNYARALQTDTSIWLPGQFPDHPQLCSAGVLHASDVPAESLVGGWWPCRLFEVTGVPVTQEGHKFGFRRLHVEHELPAWQALGPNGERVVAVLDRASRLTSDEIKALDAAWDAARAAARAAAWDAARAAALDAAWDAARAAARDAARDAAWAAARDVTWAATWAAARAAARDVTRDAAWTEVVSDLISPEQYQLLAGPWLSVVGGSVPA